MRLMHPWFIDYQQVEEPIRRLVWILNNTGLVETLDSCGGHPEDDYWTDNFGRAYILFRIIDRGAWAHIRAAVRRAAVKSKIVETSFHRDGSEEWIVFQLRTTAQPEVMRGSLDSAIDAAERAIAPSLCSEHLELEQSRKQWVPAGLSAGEFGN